MRLFGLAHTFQVTDHAVHARLKTLLHLAPHVVMTSLAFGMMYSHHAHAQATDPNVQVQQTTSAAQPPVEGQRLSDWLLKNQKTSTSAVDEKPAYALGTIWNSSAELHSQSAQKQALLQSLAELSAPIDEPSFDNSVNSVNSNSNNNSVNSFNSIASNNSFNPINTVNSNCPKLAFARSYGGAKPNRRCPSHLPNSRSNNHHTTHQHRPARHGFSSCRKRRPELRLGVACRHMHDRCFSFHQNSKDF